MREVQILVQTVYDVLTRKGRNLHKLAEDPDLAFLNIRVASGRVRETFDESRAEKTVDPSIIGNMIDVDRFRGCRVLEVGPKHGHHSKWIDKYLQPSLLCFAELPSKKSNNEHWASTLQSPHRFIYSDMLKKSELHDQEPFDLVLFLGVLYHSVELVKLLNVLWRLTRPGGTLLVESNVDQRAEALTVHRYAVGQIANYSKPTRKAIALMLGMTGWDNIELFSGHRSGRVLLSCTREETQPVGYTGITFGGSTV